jgi:transcription elongation factor Elf1
MFEKLRNNLKREQEYLKKKYNCKCENFLTCGMYLNPNENWLYCNSCFDSHDEEVRKHRSDEEWFLL